MWQSRVEIDIIPLCIVIVLLLPLRAGLVCTCVDVSGIHASTLPYEPLPLTEGLHCSPSNVVTQLKYTME